MNHKSTKEDGRDPFFAYKVASHHRGAFRRLGAAGRAPEIVRALFHSTIVLDDLLGRYLSAEQRSEEVIKVVNVALAAGSWG